MSKIKIQYIKEPQTTFEFIAEILLRVVIVGTAATVGYFVFLVAYDVLDNNSKLEQLLKRPVQQRIIVMPPIENFPLVPNTDGRRFEGNNWNENTTRITNNSL